MRVRMIDMRRSAVFLGLAMMLAAPFAAHAQSAQSLANDIERLSKEVRALQRQVFQGDTKYFSQSGQPGAPSASASSASVNAAAILVRLDDLEQRLRTLTGRGEELSYSQRQLESAFTDFRAQTNYRLQALEGSGNGAAVASPQSDAGEAAASADKAVASGDEAVPSDGVAEVAPALAAQEKPLPKDAFAKAFELAKRDQFDDAEQAFTLFLVDYPDDPLASNAQYWLGRVYTAKKQPSDAAEAFFNGYYKYPEGNKAPENLLALASTLRVMDQREDACKALTLLKSQLGENKYPSVTPRVLQGVDNENNLLGCN